MSVEPSGESHSVRNRATTASTRGAVLAAVTYVVPVRVEVVGTSLHTTCDEYAIGDVSSDLAQMRDNAFVNPGVHRGRP